MRKLTISLLILLALAIPAHAEIKGFVAVDYDTMNKDWVWTLNVDKHLTDWWLVGTSMATYAPEYGFKHFIPAWVPHRLDYEVYTEVHYKNFSLRVTSWCDHWFAQSDHDWSADKWGLTMRLRYDF
jgi:hypothetical protein